MSVYNQRVNSNFYNRINKFILIGYRKNDLNVCISFSCHSFIVRLLWVRDYYFLIPTLLWPLSYIIIADKWVFYKSVNYYSSDVGVKCRILVYISKGVIKGIL